MPEDPRYGSYRQALERRGFRIQQVTGDGNCLFRYVARIVGRVCQCGSWLQGKQPVPA